MRSARELTALTIGGFSKTDTQEQRRLFSEYIKKALPDQDVTDVNIISGAASLNSITASGMIAGRKYFFKVHIEADGQPADEYKLADLLKEAGWPIYPPAIKSDDPDFPLLAYIWTDNPTLFDKLERSYKVGRSELQSEDLDRLETMNRLIGQAELGSFKKVSAMAANDAPIQMFFARRFEKDGRIDKWYEPETVFSLPAKNGENVDLQWSRIRQAKWVINNVEFSTVIDDIVQEAREALAFSGEDEAWAVTSHGDDHAGNIFLNADEALVFDPAAASDINPAVLSEAKALAHNGFLPMAGMYYDPSIEYVYEYDEAVNTIKVSADFSSSPVFGIHMEIAKQIIDLRLNPLLQTLSETGADMEKEYARFKTALAACAILTVDISKLLKAGGGRGAGLLPMTILLYELKGFDVLERIS